MGPPSGPKIGPTIWAPTQHSGNWVPGPKFGPYGSLWALGVPMAPVGRLCLARWLGAHGAIWPGPKWAHMAGTQMGPYGRDSNGPIWPGPKWAHMARTQMGPYRYGLGPKWTWLRPRGRCFVEGWFSHKVLRGTPKGRWILGSSQTLWAGPTPLNPPRKNVFTGIPHFPGARSRVPVPVPGPLRAYRSLEGIQLLCVHTSPSRARYG